MERMYRLPQSGVPECLQFAILCKPAHRLVFLATPIAANIVENLRFEHEQASEHLGRGILRNRLPEPSLRFFDPVPQRYARGDAASLHGKVWKTTVASGHVTLNDLQPRTQRDGNQHRTGDMSGKHGRNCTSDEEKTTEPSNVGKIGPWDGTKRSDCRWDEVQTVIWDENERHDHHDQATSDYSSRYFQLAIACAFNP